MADTGGGGGGGQGGLPPCTHTHTLHAQDTHNFFLDFLLLTLLALDVQTLKKSYKAGLEVDLLQRQRSIIVLVVH